MKLFPTREKTLSHPDSRGSWWNVIREPFTGAWQRNLECKHEDMLAFSTVFTCITLIASDIAKMGAAPFKRSTPADVWEQFYGSPVYSRLQNPNWYQTGAQFFESWLISKLAHGNAYIFMQSSGIPGAAPYLHVLNPDTVQPLISDSGSVFYGIGENRLTGNVFGLNIPAEYIMHDRFNCLYHPLVGISPLYAAALPVIQAREIQRSNALLFKNNASPGGILTVPGNISDEMAAKLRETWESQNAGPRRGGVAVLPDGMQYSPIQINATDAQVVEQLKWTAEQVCGVFHVPLYKAGLAQPTTGNTAQLNQEYYNSCLHRLVVDAQELMWTALMGGSMNRAVRFDVSALMMMDPNSQMDYYDKGSKMGAFEPDYIRRNLGLGKTPGGNTPYLQQQNYSLAALARRDASVGVAAPAPAETAPVEPAQPDITVSEQTRSVIYAAMLRKELTQ